MIIELPGAIAGYFAADATKDADRVARCFTPDAVVRDEKQTHRGRDAIRLWKANSSTAYSYTVERHRHINLIETKKAAAAARQRPSGHLADTRLLLPDGESVGSIGPIFGGRHKVPARVGMLVNGAMGGEKLLGLPG